MKPKETINLYRVISLLVIALVTFGVMGGLCAKSHLYPDEWLSMFFLTLIFLLVCIFELEYERKQKGISANTQTTFIRLSVTYTVSGGLIYAISYLPEFYRPVMIPVILLTAVSNSMVAVSFGLFFDLVLALTVGGSFYACRCAKEVGYRANLCLAGGFYYRMGRWIGEPYIKNAVNKAESLCFPAELISILAEYYGEEQLPSSPESALVHMVDAVVIRLEAMEQNVGQSVWNRDIVIYQTVNDFSSSEIYDHSGMSMNQFLKIREFLAKEELLR